MKYYTVDKFAIVILPSGMSEKAKSSKSLFNSFNRIYRFATIGGVSLAAWFSAQFIQQNNRVVLSNARANSGNQLNAPESAFTASSPEMAMKSAPIEETQSGIESIESAPAYEAADQATPIVEPQSTEGLADQYVTPPESAMPMDGDMLSYITSSDAPIFGEPISDFYLLIIIALSVGMMGLIIDRIICARKK